MALAIFPTIPGVTWPISRRPSFNTQMQGALSGKRTSISFQREPRWSYEFDIELARLLPGFTELSDLLTVFLGQRGRGGTFLYNDTDDNTATANQIGVGDGATRTFFLTRTAFGFSQRIAGAALNGAAVLTVNGITAVGYTIADNGVVTFSVAPAAGQVVTWTGAYYWLCRFDDDQLDLSKFQPGFFAAKSLKFSTEIITG